MSSPNIDKIFTGSGARDRILPGDTIAQRDRGAVDGKIQAHIVTLER